MTLRQQISDLLLALRGDVTRSVWARMLNTHRESLIRFEAGNISLDKLDDVGQAMGIRFVITAVDDKTGRPVTGPSRLALNSVRAEN